MAIREVLASSPLSASVAGRVTTLHELAREEDKRAAHVDAKLSVLADWVEHRYKSITAAYSIVDETVILADATGGAFAVTLPPSNSETINRDVHIKRLNAGVNAVTITAAGTDTIDGAATQVLAIQYTSLHMVADGAGKWWLV